MPRQKKHKEKPDFYSNEVERLIYIDVWENFPLAILLCIVGFCVSIFKRYES